MSRSIHHQNCRNANRQPAHRFAARRKTCCRCHGGERQQIDDHEHVTRHRAAGHEREPGGESAEVFFGDVRHVGEHQQPDQRWIAIFPPHSPILRGFTEIDRSI
jgi:hypothetical protein